MVVVVDALSVDAVAVAVEATTTKHELCVQLFSQSKVRCCTYAEAADGLASAIHRTQGKAQAFLALCLVAHRIDGPTCLYGSIFMYFNHYTTLTFKISTAISPGLSALLVSLSSSHAVC